MTADRKVVDLDKSNPVPGRVFDSRKEATRYVELLGRLDRGEIMSLRCGVTIPLKVNGVVVCRYKADFVYVEGGRYVVEDVKSKITRMNRVYVLKKKLLAAIYGHDIRET